MLDRLSCSDPRVQAEIHSIEAKLLGEEIVKLYSHLQHRGTFFRRETKELWGVPPRNDQGVTDRQRECIGQCNGEVTIQQNLAPVD